MKKKLFVGLLFIFACKNLIAQNPVPEFQLPLYCSDALNNKDTIYVGYDMTAQFGFSDNDFGEKDIRYEPFKEEFDARVGSYRPQQWTLPYLSKILVERRSCTVSTPTQNKGVNVRSNLYFKIKHFPLKIAWDSLLIDKVCNYNSFMHRSPLSEVNGKYKVEDRIYLKHKKEIVISKEWMRDAKKAYQNLVATQDIIIQM